MHRLRLGTSIVAFALLALVVPLAAAADGGRDKQEVRKRITCGQRTEAELRVRAKDDEIRIDYELEPRQGSGTWRIIILHDRQTVGRTSLGGASPTLRRTVDDWYGADTITIRATSQRGEACLISATL